jgi:hypothetical protein
MKHIKFDEVSNVKLQINCNLELIFQPATFNSLEVSGIDYKMPIF